MRPHAVALCTAQPPLTHNKLCAVPGIQCFRDLAALLSYCAELEFKVVAQRYITRPLVIRRKKVRNCHLHSLLFALRRW